MRQLSRHVQQFAFEVNMTINQGDCGGLLLRDDSDHSNLYLFQVCQDGRYNFSTYVNHNSTGELASGNPSAIKQGLNQSNVIAVVALGSNFDMYVNGQKIDSVTDDTYSGGYVGLEVTALNNETMVTYQNARLWTIQ